MLARLASASRQSSSGLRRPVTERQGWRRRGAWRSPPRLFCVPLAVLRVPCAAITISLLSRLGRAPSRWLHLLRCSRLLCAETQHFHFPLPPRPDARRTIHSNRSRRSKDAAIHREPSRGEEALLAARRSQGFLEGEGVAGWLRALHCSPCSLLLGFTLLKFAARTLATCYPGPVSPT